MKKPVIIIVAVIYVASILLVGFFGVQAQFDNLTVYAEKIECINEDRKDAAGNELVKVEHKDAGWTQIKLYDFHQIYYEEAASFKIDWKVSPADVTNSEVRFSYDENEMFSVITESGPGQVQGTVKFHKYPENGVEVLTLNRINIKSADGSGAKTYVVITCIIKSTQEQGGNA